MTILNVCPTEQQRRLCVSPTRLLHRRGEGSGSTKIHLASLGS